jgi:hypothetical protein
MPRKPGLTKEQHFDLGLELVQAQDAINAAIIKVGSNYPVNGREVKALERVTRALEKARSVLDDAVCRELPNSDRSATEAYYPPSAGLSGACHWSS